jgi:hypothetical protein
MLVAIFIALILLLVLVLGCLYCLSKIQTNTGMLLLVAIDYKEAQEYEDALGEYIN